MPHASEYFMILIGELQTVRNGFMQDQIDVTRLYPSVDPRYDARISAYTKAINAINSTHLALTFIAKHLLHDEWWAAITHKQIPDADKKVYVVEFVNFTTIAFVQGLFLVVESSLRIFLRALDSSACNGGTAEFKSIYDCLFKSKLSSAPHEGIELLDLFRLVRNTVHNNGIYFHKTGKDTSVNWGGETFVFKHGAPIDFATLEFVIRISKAVRKLLREVVEDASLRAIRAPIND